MRTLRVTDVARELGCSKNWLRPAESRGRIPEARRDLNRWRWYTEEDLETIRNTMFPEDNGIAEK
jgi:DNA-binding transcriptional MerR regulator